MELQEIKDRVADIEKWVSQGVNDRAHLEEDILYVEFIKYVATRTDRLGDKAKEVLKTNKIEYDRWYS